MDRIREYRIISKIGEGGMGEVFLAEDENLGRKVAIKMLAPELMRNAELVERFKQEARLQASLIHPNIVALYTFFIEDNNFYMVMEYAEGETLKEVIKKNRKIEEETAKKIMLQLLEGVGYAHQLGIIHRDLKPSNIIVGKDLRVKIMDFGIAKALGDRGMTKTGTKMGTLYYMSPEQIKAEKDIDQRTDIYSLGIIFYEMLTGKVPFNTETESDFEVMRDIVDNDISNKLNLINTFSNNTKSIITRMTSNYKSNRYVTCYVCSEEIQHITNNTVSYTPPNIFTPKYSDINDLIVPEMIDVEGGTYQNMEEGLLGNKKTGPIKRVSDFRIGKYPVTQKEWVSIGLTNNSFFKDYNSPVTNVSFLEVLDYITKLNKLTGRKFGLPTLEMWEYAAYGGKQQMVSLYSGSNNLDEVGWFYENSFNKLYPVGKKRPNALNIYDMCGNVFEMTKTKTSSSIIIKGGSYASSESNCKIINNIWISVNQQKNNLGFRLIENI